LQPVPSLPTVCLLLRLSKADDDTIEIQERNGRRFAAELFPGLAIEVFADNGVSGDDWDARTALGEMMQRLRPGSIVIARDAARLGRTIVDSLLFIREICQRKQARLFYYQTRKETRADNPTDWVINAVEAFGAEAEHKKIIENTRQKLYTFAEDIASGRLKVERPINGGCYGYRNVEMDGEPIAIVHEVEAQVVRQIYRWNLDGMGARLICARLNADKVPPPYADRKAERKGRTWSPRTVDEMLANPRYRGLVVWGVTYTDRSTGKKQRLQRPEPLLEKFAPSLRIVDDELWHAVQEARAKRSLASKHCKRSPAVKYALSSLARCAECGGSINVRGWPRTMANGRRVQVYSYGCAAHTSKGKAVCTMSLRQPVEEVEAALASRIATELDEPRIAQLVALVRAAMERRLSSPNLSVDALQKEIGTLRKRLRRIEEDMEQVDDRRGLYAKHKETSGRLKEAERELADAWKAPKEREASIEQAEHGVRSYLVAMRDNLQSADRKLKRQAFEALFPGGLYFAPVTIPKGTLLPKKSPRKRIFRIEGDSDVALAIVNSRRNSFLKHSELTTGSARKDSNRIVVLALPRAA
jgi:hypothetical protein